MPRVCGEAFRAFEALEGGARIEYCGLVSWSAVNTSVGRLVGWARARPRRAACDSSRTFVGKIAHFCMVGGWARSGEGGRRSRIFPGGEALGAIVRLG
jgi:hypothetical protein